MGWFVFSCGWSASLKVECPLRRWAVGMPESTGTIARLKDKAAVGDDVDDEADQVSIRDGLK